MPAPWESGDWWVTPEFEPDRIWHEPEVLIFSNSIFPGVSCYARGYDVANRRWYELNVDTVVCDEDDWMSGVITKHIKDYYSKHNSPPDFNVINTSRQESFATFERKPYENIARRMRSNFHYGRGESDVLPRTAFEEIKQKAHLNSAVDRCVWRGMDCVFKRIEFVEDIEVVEREVTTRHQLLKALKDDPDAGATMQERFRILPILAVVNKHAETDEVSGLLFPYGGKSLEDLAGGYKYGMGYNVNRDEEEGSGDEGQGETQTEDDALTGLLPLLPITEVHLQDLARAAQDLSRTGVLHGDINDRNTLLMSDDRLVLVDLGEVAPDYKSDSYALGSMMLWVLERVDWDNAAMERVREMAASLQREPNTEGSLRESASKRQTRSGPRPQAKRKTSRKYLVSAPLNANPVLCALPPHQSWRGRHWLMEKTSLDAEKRVRKHHTRSRAGCQACRKSHLRCDRGQPECDACVRARRTCVYAPPDLPLRERRALGQPGQMSPWMLSANQARPISLVTRAVDQNPVDPFGCLPVEMPFASKKLLHYFLRLQDNFGTDSDTKTTLLPALVQNPVALRNTMLIAGLHYVWTTRDISTFDATVLFHRTETIQFLNTQLKNPETLNVLTLVNHIATLCFTECALGNMTMANAHLNGLVTVLDHFYPTEKMLNTPMGLEEELTNRYALLEAHLVLSMKTRMQENPLLSQLAGQAATRDLSQYANLLFHWHTQDVGDLQRQLSAISMHPFFFAAPSPKARFKQIDATPVLECLRDLTYSAATLNVPHSGDSPPKDPDWAWMQGIISHLHFALVESHVISLYGSTGSGARQKPINQPLLRTSWLSLATTAGLYVHSILGLWNGGNPINARLYRHMMTTLLRDIARLEMNLKMVDFWFWIHFVCAFSVAWHQERAYNHGLQVVEDFFNAALQSWSQLSKVVQWEEAQERLRKFAWPTEGPGPLAKKVWEKAIGLCADEEWHKYGLVAR